MHTKAAPRVRDPGSQCKCDVASAPAYRRGLTDSTEGAERYPAERSTAITECKGCGVSRHGLGIQLPGRCHAAAACWRPAAS
eukprot:4826261-Alexandrium_andersonii.AAC.1